ncbi:MAG: tRNA (adenosine(37)-N6)-dimethylallyltransferase MiaA [Clostridia bacterium]|nr:tRNA (adenosine(37)-N6)-dimethylallyltransferase MiaA [Clostridia bacterium]
MNKIRILAVVGPTASGKTALSIALAKRLNGEIVSCDSMQIYRRMNVGTAKPTPEEMDGVVHHLLDIAEPDTPFSVAEYVSAAKNAVEEICKRGKLPIFCGGTGLYLDSFLRGGGFEETNADPELRRELFAYAETHGVHALHERLRAVDPESADAIHENNVKRVVRALEIFETAGITKTEADKRSREPHSPYRATVVGLTYADRSVLYGRIAKRVDQMLSDGLLEEARTLEAEGVFARNSTAAQAIGYKELLGYLHGEEPLPAAVDRLVTATRHYAKRQMTWFRAKEYIHPIHMERDGSLRSPEEVADEVIALFEQESERDGN